MTDDEFKRTPIAAAPLSVLLLVGDPRADLENSVARWIDFLRQLQRTFEIIVVDRPVARPASETKLDMPEQPPGEPAEPDHAPEEKPDVHRLTQRFGEVRFVHAEADGLGARLRAGLAEATQPLVFFTMADERYQPADLKKLLQGIDQCDLVTGVRTAAPIPRWLKAVDFCVGWFCLLLFGLPLEPRIAWLGWGGLGRRLLAQWFFGVGVHDPECMYCLVRREMLRRIVIQSAGSFAAVEFLAKANFLNALLAEVPLAVMPGPDYPAEGPSFLHDAALLFRRPDFGPAKLGEPEAPSSRSRLPGGT